MSSRDLYSLSAYQFDLPEELIAQQPCKQRDGSRLMLIDRQTGSITSTTFRSLLDILNQGDRLIFNDTRVIPSRLKGKRSSGGNAEIFLTRRHNDGSWDALVRPGKKMPPGTIVNFNSDFFCEVIEILASGERRVRFHCQGDLDRMLEECGQIPLPHYIRREPTIEDRDRYQTVFADRPGAVAAPTAGLHFTSEMLTDLRNKGIEQTKVTLHVGLGTFRPVQSDDIRDHSMHSERYFITSEAADELNSIPEGKRQICVGTTCCRTLETAADREGRIHPGDFETNIFIYPGYSFKYVKGLLTNFHLPGSTLLMLVSAFAGYDLMREAYAKAVEERYRFFSYGDAMLIL